MFNRGSTKTRSTDSTSTTQYTSGSQGSSIKIEEALAQRAERRTARKLEKAAKIEELKIAGNKLFKEGDYAGAVEHYTEAIVGYGAKALLHLNLAAAYLKLECYEEAEAYATSALEHEPRNIKARYRRGLARKEQENYRGALIDFETIMMEDPTCHEAVEQERIVRRLLLEEDEDDEFDTDDDSSDYEWPGYDQDPMSDSSDESDSSDCHHSGNGIPCRFYNHEGCNKGDACRYSHAPDEKSIRDNLGKNVCFYSLLGICKYGAKCIYSHTKEYLGHGWWNDQSSVNATRTLVESGVDLQFVRNVIRNLPLHDMLDYEHLEAINKPMPHRSPAQTPPAGGYKGKGKATSSNISTPQQVIMLLSLDDMGMLESYNEPLLAALRAQVELVKVLTARDAFQHLASPQLIGIFVTDAAIAAPKHSTLLAKLVDFAKSGGSVVVGSSFSSFIRPIDLAKFFKKSWGLNWTAGSYHRTTFALNTSHYLAKSNPSLIKSFSMKALHVRDFAPDVALYKPTESSQIQGLVFAPHKVDLSESPVVHTRIGLGYFGYIGDVNSEEGSAKAILAMLGLLDAPLPSQKDGINDLSNSKASPKAGPSERKPNSITPEGKNGSTASPSRNQRNPVAAPTVNIPKAGPSVSSTSPKGRSGVQTSTQKAETLRPDTKLPVDSDTGVSGSNVKPKPSNPFVMLLSLENEEFFAASHAHLLSALRVKTEWKQALDAQTALTMLASPDIVGALVTDPGIVRAKNSHVLHKLVEFVKAGGSAVVGGLFSTFASTEDIDTFFAEPWGLTWKSASYHRASFVLNSNHEMAKNQDSLPPNYMMKALHVRGILPSHPIYLPRIESRLHSTTANHETINDHSESPAVQAKIGLGYLGYIGDVGPEEESTSVIIAMLGLLNLRRKVETPPAQINAATATKGKSASPKEDETFLTNSATEEEGRVPKVSPKKTTRPFIMVLPFGNVEFFTNVQKDLLFKFRNKLEVLYSLSNERVVDLLSSTDLVGVLVTDAAIADPDNAYLLARLVEYTKGGGTVVIAGSFGGSMTSDDVASFFDEAWGLPWKAGSFTRTDMTLNEKHDLASKHPSLPAMPCMKALHISGIAPSAAVYVAVKQSHIYTKRITQAAVIHTEVGEGYLGYLGDVGFEENHTKIVLAMFNLD